MARILVAEPVAGAGIEILQAAHDTQLRPGLARPDLLALLSEGEGWDALVVRSQTRVDDELLTAAAPRLSVIGVASVGTDRIDLAAATRAGVMVVNAPTGNTIAAAEHTMALMLALLRRVPSADASLRAGEWERGRFTGAELRHRTLGIIGLGKIGKAVARRAAGFEMRVIAHDPYLTEEQAAEHGARLVGLPELLLRADVVTVHTPLTSQTRGLIGPAQIEAMKPGAVVLNVARGGIVDEAALASALSDGRLAGAAVDVYSAEPMAPDNPLRSAPNTVLTPHLGASTAEAQDRVAVEMAEQLLEALAGVTPTYAVNAPSVAPDVVPRLRPYVELGRRLSVLGRQLLPGAFDCLSLTYAGEIAACDCSPVRTAALAGILEAVTDQRVNAVNADLVARERGLTVRETRTDAAEPWSSLVTLELGEESDALRLAGSTAHGRPHLASLDGFELDAELAGLMLITRHQDQPGVVGAVGTALAAAGVNISSLELSRLSAAGEAMMVVSVDSPVPEEVLAALRAAPGIREARVVELPALG
ncbi:MAG TPA: phosphoglycerate dehydrogenase [Candidatus Limnocylindria bacterium]|nr:phosphoglycerate dehydrogenase [Candidatus Limnocylindria bacterium]